MPVAYVSNRVPDRNYEPLEREFPISYVTTGPELNIEFITRLLIHSTPQDFLVLDGSPLIAAVCLSLWLEIHGEVSIIQLDSGKMHRISRTSLRKFLTITQDQERPYGRG